MNGTHYDFSLPVLPHDFKRIRPVGEQLIFDFHRAGLEIPGDKPLYTTDERTALIDDWLRKYEEAHRPELESVGRPSGFMVGVRLREDGDLSPRKLEKQYPGRFLWCEDPVLTVAVLGRVSETLYVPRRELRLSCEFVGLPSRTTGFNGTIAFPRACFGAVAARRVET